MASTNKTANLGLNQWVLSDPLLMADMNADNQKIDTAFGMSVFSKLMDVTTTANAQQVDLNVSSIDFTKYSMIQVFATIKAAPENTALNLFARINGGGAFMRSLDDASLNGQNYVGIGYANQSTDPASSMKLEFFGFPDVLTAVYMMHIHSSGVYYYNGYKVMEHFGVKDFAANQSLTAINFVTDNSNVYIKAGSKFKIYGVKK